MLTVRELATFGAAPELVVAWSPQLYELTDIQERAVRAGALDGKSNLLVVAPTTSGKTFVGEMAATAAAYSQRRRAIFLVPFKALAEEHYLTFKARYGDLLSVAISTSDWTEFDADVADGNFNLAVLTYEKLVGFLVKRPDLVARCGALVVDEVQSLSDGERGANLEVLLTRVRMLEQGPQLVALSASLDDVNGLDTWLGATLVMSNERPIPLTEMVCALTGAAIKSLADGETVAEELVAPQADRDSLIEALCQELAADGKQVIVFRSTIRQVEETARRVRQGFRAVGIPSAVAGRLNELDDSDALRDLRLGLASGVGFHTADLTHAERQIVEDAFRNGQARVIVATTTLAMGVNLPTDVVVFADTTRWLPQPGGWRPVPISVAEYKNAVGRAGRLGQRQAGTGILLADDWREQRQLLRDYVLGKPEPVESQLPRHPLADIVFNLLCSQLVRDEEGAATFISATFAYPSFYERAGGPGEVRTAVEAAVHACLESGLVVADGDRLAATQLGRVFAAAGLSLGTASQLAALIEEMRAAPLVRTEIIYVVAARPEIGSHPWLLRRRGMELDPRPDQAPDTADCPPASAVGRVLLKPDITTAEALALVRARCLLDWMAGTPERDISARFRDMGAAPARVRDLGKAAAWLLDALAEAAEWRGVAGEQVAAVRNLAAEARFGLPAALAPLARLRVPGVSRDALLGLYSAAPGLAEPETLLDASEADVGNSLTALQLERLRRAILDDYDEALRRRAAGHLARAGQTSLPLRLVNALYSTDGAGLEQAVADCLVHVGLSATRILRQPHGEEDIQIAHADGTVVVSVTASTDDNRPVKWNKVKEVLGTGAGLNPKNYVCVARPGFDWLAEQKAAEIAREAGPRSLLLVPIPVLAEALVRTAEGSMTGLQLGDVLARERGILTLERLPTVATKAGSIGGADP